MPAAMFDKAVYDTLSLALDSGTLAPASDGQALILRAEPSPQLRGLTDRAMICHNSYKPWNDALKAEGYAVLAPDLDCLPDAALTIIFPPRQRDEARALFARALQAAPEGGVILACLPNTLGAKSGESMLKSLAGSVESLSKNKCRAFWTVKRADNLDRAGLDDALSADLPAAREDGVWSRPGLFAWDRVDKGSELLADCIPEFIEGHGADFGAGQGYLSREVLRHCPKVSHMTLLEAEHRALPCISGTMADVANWDASWCDVTADAGQRQFDFVVMNPPFHTGRADNAGLGQAFIRAAARAIKTGGTLWMVANRHLPYEAVLGECFKGYDTVDEEGTYKVIRADKPKV